MPPHDGRGDCFMGRRRMHGGFRDARAGHVERDASGLRAYIADGDFR